MRRAGLCCTSLLNGPWLVEYPAGATLGETTGLSTVRNRLPALLGAFKVSLLRNSRSLQAHATYKDLSQFARQASIERSSQLLPRHASPAA